MSDGSQPAAPQPSSSFNENLKEFLISLPGTLRSLIRNLVATVWLVLLYAVTIWMVVGTLSAIQMRDELVISGHEGAYNDVQRALFRMNKRQKEIFEEILERDQLSKLQKKADDIASTLIRVLGVRRSLTFTVNDQVFVQTTTTFSQSSSDRLRVSEEFRDARHNCQEQDEDKRNYSKAVCNDVVQFVSMRNTIEEYRNSPDMAEFQKFRDERLAEMDALHDKEELSRHFSTTEFFERWRYTEFAIMPRPVLVMLLTISMGILGSVITMTWAILGNSGERPNAKALAMLPLVGGMSAFVILVFAKAGQITLTAGADPGSLNPFFISFLGIISGLLSERAYERMARIGSSFFESGDETPRWGIGLDKIVKQEEIDPNKLALAIGINQKEFANIIQGETQASAEKQTLIAAALRRPKEALFTDLKPPVINDSEEENSEQPKVEPTVLFLATGLAEALTEEGQTVDAMALALELDKSELEAIIDGTIPVPADLREKIAAFLNRKPEGLFTEERSPIPMEE